MNLKYYLRGLGVGIVVTALIMGISLGGKKESLSDKEIKARASELGMVEAGTTLKDNLPEKEEQQEKDEPGYRYQVETEYLTQAISSDEYHDCWSEEHPDYVMRVLSCISFDDGGSAFVVLFHEKVK